jgi:integrase
VTDEPTDPGSALATRESVVTAARGYADAALAENTRRVIRDRLRVFAEFAARWGRQEWPPEPASLALWATELAEKGRSLATVRAYLYAVAAACKAQGHPNPVLDPRVRAVVRGIARTKAQRGEVAAPKAALTVAQLRKIVTAPAATGALSIRNRAMVLLSFYAALRRSELVALSATDVTEEARGLVVRVARSKTDQAGEGIVKVVPRVEDPTLDPVRALQAWRKVAGLAAGATGPLWYSWPGGRFARRAPTAAVWAASFRRMLAAAELDTKKLGAHSLRAGWATEAARHGARVEQIQRHLGHASPEMAMRYVREEDHWRNHPGALMR